MMFGRNGAGAVVGPRCAQHGAVPVQANTRVTISGRVGRFRVAINED